MRRRRIRDTGDEPQEQEEEKSNDSLRGSMGPNSLSRSRGFRRQIPRYELVKLDTERGEIVCRYYSSNTHNPA